MKNKLIHLSAFLATAMLMFLLSCEKKSNLESILKNGEDDSPSVNSSTTSESTTGNTTDPMDYWTGRIIGSSSSDIFGLAQVPCRQVLLLNPVTYASEPAFATTFVSGERYFGAAAYSNHTCIIRKTDGNSIVYLDYISSLGNYNCDLTLAGAAFLPDEIEMTAASTNNVYAIRGNSLYRIDNITTLSATAVLIYTFPAGWANYRRTICQTGSSTSLRVFVAETGAAKGSSVSNLKAYTLSNLNVLNGVTLSSLEATIPISYNNILNLSSFSYVTGLSATDWYHIVISDGTANSSATYRLAGTTTLSGSFSSVGSFSVYVNDCSFYY